MSTRGSFDWLQRNTEAWLRSRSTRSDEVLDHVVSAGDEVLPIIRPADRGLVLDHQSQFVGDVEHVRRGRELVDPHEL